MTSVGQVGTGCSDGYHVRQFIYEKQAFVYMRDPFAWAFKGDVDADVKINLRVS